MCPPDSRINAPMGLGGLFHVQSQVPRRTFAVVVFAMIDNLGSQELGLANLHMVNVFQYSSPRLKGSRSGEITATNKPPKECVVMSAPSHRKSRLRQETPDFPSTHSIEPKKNDHTPYPKLKSPKPQNPHPPPVTFPPSTTHPNSARPAPRRRSTPDAGLVSPAATNRKHPPTNPNPAAAAPISTHSTVPTTTAHT